LSGASLTVAQRSKACPARTEARPGMMKSRFCARFLALWKMTNSVALRMASGAVDSGLLPPRGGGLRWGGGHAREPRRQSVRSRGRGTPHPNPPPQGGRGRAQQKRGGNRPPSRQVSGNLRHLLWKCGKSSGTTSQKSIKNGARWRFFEGQSAISTSVYKSGTRAQTASTLRLTSASIAALSEILTDGSKMERHFFGCDRDQGVGSRGCKGRTE
jgi:hypothetical protein